MTTEELMEIWHNKPENKNLGARKSAIKFAEYYHQEQVEAGVTYEGVGVSSKINDYVDLTTEQAEAHNEEDLDLCSICGDASTVNCTICRTESC